MSERKKRTWYERLLRIEPGISLTQWGYDRIASNWDRLAAAFIGGGGMSYLAAVTDWMAAWGPLGIGAVGLLAALAVWLVLALAAILRAKAKLHQTSANAIEKWKEQVDSVNPLAPEFHTKRLRIGDIAHPINQRITDKRFIDCELIGPANIVLAGAALNGASFMNCDMVVARHNAFIQNAVVLERVTMIGGKIWNTTIFIGTNDIHHFRAMGANIISLTGVPEIDNQARQGTGGRTQP
jgi:hypothetical protein